MINNDRTRVRGIEFGALIEELASVDYPATASELVTAYGDAELGHPDGSQRFRTVIEPLGPTTFVSSTDVVQSVIMMVDGEAVGRQGYTDRGTSPIGTVEVEDPMSL